MIDDPLFDIPVVLKVKGIKGDKGERGYDGAAGVNGIKGRRGADGKDGRDGIDGKDGKDGLSIKGDPGRDGVDGKSAYQLWLSLGNKGSVEEYILSLRGDDGLSAYDIWLKNNDGTEEDFLKSLKGKDAISTYQNIGMSVPDIAGQVGRLKVKGEILSTDDIIIRRDKSLFRVSFIDVNTAARPYTIISESYPVLDNDYYIEAAIAGITVTLLTAVEREGKEYSIDNSSGGNVFVNTTSSQTINGELTQIVPPNSAMLVVSNGTNWRIK